MRRLLFILVISCNLLSNYNNHGNHGYLNVPSAYSLEEGHYVFNFSRNKPERRYSLTLSPFDWFDASLFYVDITRKEYGNNFKQSYKDKGFSIKVSPFNVLGHQVAIGLNDLAGTGFFASEYLVLSNTFNRFEYSAGLGWGAFDKGISFHNPLINLNQKFRNREIGYRDKGGNFEVDKYFSGDKASLFFGGAYQLNDRYAFIFERDPTNTIRSEVPYSSKKTGYSFGIIQNYKNFSMKYSFQRGKTFGVQFSYFDDATKSRIKTTRKNLNIKTFSELQNELNNHEIGLKKISASTNQISTDVRQINYFDQEVANKILVESVEYLAKAYNYEEIVVKQYYQGMQVSSNSYDANFHFEIEEAKSQGDEVLKYYVEDEYPYFRQKIYPSVRNFIAGREGFYFGGLFLENDIQIIFEENLLLISNLKVSIWDNFDNLVYPPVDTYPQQVRSDNKEYFKGFRKNIAVGRLELNHFYSPSSSHFFRTSIGIFEEMFGGFGVDYVYSPEKSLMSFGLEGYYLKKRDYNMNFDFKSYSNNLYRASFQILEPRNDIRFKISFGEYIAGDIGYTFEVKRTFKNGAEMGAFFSRTNVSKELFGEGSFDKGIVFRLPLPSLFGRGNNLSKYEWRPLTKDPAALLIKSIDLMSEIDRYRFY